MLVNPNRNGSTVAPPIPAGHSEIPAGAKWFTPPLPAEDAPPTDEHVRPLLEELRTLMSDRPLRAWRLIWNYVTMAQAAAAAWAAIAKREGARLEEAARRAEARREELDREIAATEARCQNAAVALEDAHASLAGTAASAGLVIDPHDVSPESVNRALQAVSPSESQIAGAEGIGSFGRERPGFLAKVLSPLQLFEVLGPTVSGFMLSVCLGTLIGLLSLPDLRRTDRALPLIVALVLGFVIVRAVGEVVSNVVGAACRGAEQTKSACPRLSRGTAAVAALAVLAVCLCAAEITAEAYGLRELHSQRIEERRRLSGGARGEDVLPLWTYFLMGTLVTGPYMAYKAARAHSSFERDLRASWISQRRRADLEERMARPEFQQTLALAYRIEVMNTLVHELQERLAKLRAERDQIPIPDYDEKSAARLESARRDAIGSCQQIHAEVEAILESKEPLDFG